MKKKNQRGNGVYKGKKRQRGARNNKKQRGGNNLTKKQQIKYYQNLQKQKTILQE